MFGVSRLSLDYWVGKAFRVYLNATVAPPADLERIPGHLHPEEGLFLHWLAAHVPPGGHILEVGSWKGKSASYIASGLIASGARLHCVDAWTNQAMPNDPPEDVSSEFEANVARYRSRIEVHRRQSAEVASTWTIPLDALFIDGDHSYEGCSSDIEGWVHHVKRGGWVTFHDSFHSGVHRALKEKFPLRRRSPGFYICSIFAARKR